ncbi:MAG: Acetylornithine deacetylase [Gammaproteobacteria bacterium]|nr:Acetylornithine deacetylase [Gammaproteobacteria bacterium]
MADSSHAVAGNAASERALELLGQLVSFNTTSRLSNLELIDFVYEHLNSKGLRPHIDYNIDKTKANLYTIIGPETGDGVALSGHSDVVAVEDQDWTRDPWRLTREGGLLYGRGTTDMKGFIAAALAAVPSMLDAPLRRPVHLCISYDEEIGCVGVRSLLEYLAKQSTKPQSCIVGEPTGMEVVTAHKGKLSMSCKVKGRACHSALAPRGVNAVHAAARMIGFLMDMARRKREEGPFDEAFDVPYSTIHAGVIQGGTMLNIVPARCCFEFEFRNLPREDTADMLNEVKRFAREHVEPEMRTPGRGVEFLWRELSSFPGLNGDENDDVVTLVRRLTGNERIKKVGFGTEAGRFSRSGIRSVVCGPGSIEQAHTPDEFIEVGQLGQCERFIGDLIRHLS